MIELHLESFAIGLAVGVILAIAIAGITHWFTE